jgi:hypothetical protein
MVFVFKVFSEDSGMIKKEIINFQAWLYSKLPACVQKLFYSFRVLPSYIHWRCCEAGYRKTAKKLAPFKNRYNGYRCIVIGNGPSLRKMNLSHLQNEYTFGLNRIYLLFKELGFETSFLVSINRFVIEQFSEDLKRVNSLKILNWRYRDSHIKFDENTVFLPPSPDFRKMDGRIMKGYYPNIGSVTNVAIELAFFMGFTEVVLIGVDHNYVEKGLGSKAIVSKGNDRNHFSPNYFGDGVVWQLPDFELMEEGYRKNKELFESNGRRIVDATVNGKLDVFKKVEFMSYLENSDYKNKVS